MRGSGHVGEGYLARVLRDFEAETIRQALRGAGGDLRKAAEFLGISLRGIQHKVHDRGLYPYAAELRAKAGTPVAETNGDRANVA